MSNYKPIPSTEELLLSNVLELRALIRILERKGLIASDEVLEEVGKLKKEMDEKIRKMGREN